MIKIIGNILVFTMGCCIYLTATAQPNNEQININTATTSQKTFKDLDVKTNFEMGAFGFQEGQDESQLVFFSIRPKAHLPLSKSFGVRSDLQLNLTTGRAQSRFQNPNFNFFNMRELVAYYEPSTWINVKAGSVNQEKYFNNRMFIADRSFPGVAVASGLKNKTFAIRPNVQYAIPTSTSFESQRTEAEPLPSLRSVGLKAEWSPREWLHLDANINQFEFSQLPSVVAFQSNRLGNSVLGVDPSESFFRYGFAGLAQAYILTTRYSSRIQQEFQIGIIENTEAPSDRRRSQWVGTSLDIDFNDFAIKPNFASFYAESDSTPALYSAFEYGRNNRQGQSYGLDIQLKKMGCTIKAAWVQADLIEARPLQADLDIFNLYLEFNDVVL